MKLYLIIQSMEAGGAQRVLSNLANHWSLLGYDIVLATFRNDDSFYELDSSIKHIKLGLDSASIRDKKVRFDNLFRVKTIYKSIKSEDADLIISFMTTANVLATLASKLTKVPIIISERINFNALKSKVWRLLRRVVYPLSDVLVVQSGYDKKKYSFHKNSHIIYNPISIIDKYKNIKREKILIAVGRLVDAKGFDMLIDASVSLKQRDWKIIIVGEGEKRRELEEKISKSGLGNFIELLGVTKNIEKYYKRASISILSSRMEGFPNVLIEAMAYGCAPIAFDCLTGPRDIIKHRVNGLLVERENVPKLSEAIQYLMDNPDKINSYSNNAVTIREELSIAKISDMWLRIIPKD